MAKINQTIWKIFAKLSMSQLNQKQPLISVSMPAYNAELYIAESIESVLNQNYQNFELLVCDDGSTDRTLEIIQSYEKKDSRIKVFSVEKNIGLASVRNLISSKAHGKYIALLDSDDLCTPDRFDEQVKVLESGVCDVCASEYYTLDMSNGKKRARHRYESDADLKALLTIYNPICNSTAMISREIVTKFSYKDNLKGGPEDYDLWVNLAIAGYRFKTIKRPLVTYRLHPGQVSKQKEELMVQLFDKTRLGYIQYLGLHDLPKRIPFMQRLKDAKDFMKHLNNKIKGISGGVNREIYSRFQYRGNGVLTPLIRLERFLGCIK
jgi:glycosyltransferase involved in cell wall biosynthesis